MFTRHRTFVDHGQAKVDSDALMMPLALAKYIVCKLVKVTVQK